MFFEKRTHRVSYTRKMKLSPSIHHYPRWKAVILKSSVNYASHPVIVSALLLVPHADASRQSASQWRKSLKVSRYLLCRALLLYVDTQNKEGGNYGNKSFAESSSSRCRPVFTSSITQCKWKEKLFSIPTRVQSKHELLQPSREWWWSEGRNQLRMISDCMSARRMAARILLD